MMSDFILEWKKMWRKAWECKPDPRRLRRQKKKKKRSGFVFLLFITLWFFLNSVSWFGSIWAWQHHVRVMLPAWGDGSGTAATESRREQPDTGTCWVAFPLPGRLWKDGTTCSSIPSCFHGSEPSHPTWQTGFSSFWSRLTTFSPALVSLAMGHLIWRKK